MLVKINRGPHFGETVHVPSSQEVNLAILLGDIEPIAAPQPRIIPTEEKVFVYQSPESQQFSIRLRCACGNGDTSFYGEPDQLPNLRCVHCSKKALIPDAVIARYQDAWDTTHPRAADNTAARERLRREHEDELAMLARNREEQ